MLSSIKSAKDLETTHNDIKSGFLTIAIRKSREAQYYVNLSDSLKAEIIQYKDSQQLLNLNLLLIPLCEAAGISKKARGYLTESDLRELIHDFFSEFIYPLGENYQDTLISRYLLTLGDSLGGRMRNIIGGIASEKLTEKIVAALNLSAVNFLFLEKKSTKWIPGEKYSIDSLPNIKSLYWKNSIGERTLLYDIKVPVVNKNVDLVLLGKNCVNMTSVELKSCLSDVNNYELLGELKGGIDPAGADEHWKTAVTSLSRIRTSFQEKEPTVKTLFIGAAIEGAMAEEMYQQTVENILTKCANLTKQNQLTEVCNWITKI